jgi:hypothetical protein
MAMIPTIICKILMPLETPFSDAVFIRNRFHCHGIFKKVSNFFYVYY